MYRRYAGLFFTVCVDSVDNELSYLEIIHLFVEVWQPAATDRAGLQPQRYSRQLNEVAATRAPP